IVDDDELEILLRLRADRIEAGVEIVAVVVLRDDDRDLRRGRLLLAHDLDGRGEEIHGAPIAFNKRRAADLAFAAPTRSLWARARTSSALAWPSGVVTSQWTRSAIWRGAS